VANIVEQEIF